MLQSEQEIYLTIIIGCLLFVLLAVLFISTLLIYHNNKRKHEREVQNLNLHYNQILLQSQLEIQEHTFKQISQEIHDNIGQVLSLVRLNLNTLDSGESRQKVDATDALLSRAITDLRNLSHNLNTDLIHEAGLRTAIARLLTSLEKTGRFKTTFTCSHSLDDLRTERLIILFRMVQECINNIMKHARASEIAVSIERGEKNIAILISDNGTGFDTAILEEHTAGLGISNILRRAELIGAQVHITSTINRGTTVAINLTP